MRRAAVILSFLATLPVAPVLAQTGSTTTTTTSSTTSSTTSTTSSTIGTTTTTTQPVTTTDADPPAAFLGGASGEVQGELGSYCWAAPGGTAGRCVDKIAPPTGPTLTVARGETLTLRFATGLPLSELRVWRDGTEVALVPANRAQFRADLPPGTYQLLVSARFSAGSAGYGFRLRVTAPPTAPPAAPKPATKIALTG